MADTSSSTPRYSKRRRNQVNYYEEDADSDIDTNDIEAHEQLPQLSRPKKRKAIPQKPLPKNKIFPFLRLPAEIRDLIYRECLHDPAGIYLLSATKKYRRTVCRVSEMTLRGEPHISRASSESDDDEGEELRLSMPCKEIQRLVPALLAVCRQIHDEARDVLYDHEFYAQDTLALHSFLVDLGPRAATYVRRITLAEWGQGRGVHKAYNHACFTALTSATSLLSLTIHGLPTSSATLSPTTAATAFYRAAFPWLEAVGTVTGNPTAALALITVRVLRPETRAWGVGPRYHFPARRMYGRAREELVEYAGMEEFRGELGRLLEGRMDSLRG